MASQSLKTSHIARNACPLGDSRKPRWSHAEAPEDQALSVASYVCTPSSHTQPRPLAYTCGTQQLVFLREVSAFHTFASHDHKAHLLTRLLLTVSCNCPELDIEFLILFYIIYINQPLNNLILTSSDFFEVSWFHRCYFLAVDPSRPTTCTCSSLCIYSSWM